MVRTIEYSEQLRRDLHGIWFSLAERDPDFADRFRDSVFIAAGKIASTPAAGHGPDDILAGTLAYTMKSWVAIYAFDDERIKFLRIVHGARDFRRLF